MLPSTQINICTYTCIVVTRIHFLKKKLLQLLKRKLTLMIFCNELIKMYKMALRIKNVNAPFFNANGRTIFKENKNYFSVMYYSNGSPVTTRMAEINFLCFFKSVNRF